MIRDWQVAHRRCAKATRGQIRAAAVVVDVVLPLTQASGIEVHLEHAQGLTIGVLEPYLLNRGRVEAGPLDGYRAESAIW
ncbi:hypothetical protein IU417_25380 [Nocardia farcinica]|uniref:hypothetical protein n=1 Tax=Nocardia farcinica TaxID=37329 RepID=UPI0018957A58|nr:hypothetical protein [Nocardia farcinica]MBF6582330.1 hypothetical protein [Nocardia farcinica]